MTERSASGYVLRTWPLREADLIVSLLTLEHGKVRGVAHGARRPKSRFAGALEPLTEVRLHWRHREGQDLVSLRDLSILRSPYRRELDLAVLWTLSHVAELLDACATAEDSDEVLHRLVGAVVSGAAAGVDAGVLRPYAEAWVLRIHGVLPDLGTCAGCGADVRGEGAAWRWRLHGLACDRCAGRAAEGGPAVLAPDLAFLEQVRRRSPEDVEPPTADVRRRVGALLAHLLRDFLGRELKSARLLDELPDEPRIPPSRG